MTLDKDQRRHLTITIIVLLYVALGALGGCKSLKDNTKIKEDRVVTESSETITHRKGDTVTYFIPNIKYKDTTIVRTNRVTGTTQVLRYDSQGQIDLAQCISGAIEEITRSNKELIEAIKQKDKVKKTEFKTDVVIYIMLGLVLIVFIALIFVFKYLSRHSSILNKFLA